MAGFYLAKDSAASKGPVFMYANRNRHKHQQKIVKAQASEQDAVSFFNLLTSPELFDTLENLLPDHRERLFPPTETLSMFLAQAMHADRSCQRIVNEVALTRLVSGLSPCSTMTGGYCRARQRLPITMVSSLVQKTGALMDEHIPTNWRWQGRSVRIITVQRSHCRIHRQIKRRTHNNVRRSRG